MCGFGNGASITGIEVVEVDSQKTGRESRLWLQAYQRSKLDELRHQNFEESKSVRDVTLVAYTFPKDPADFDFIEFSILHSWKLLGLLRVVIVADRMTPQLTEFRGKYPATWVDVQVEPKLQCGNITSMSADCVQRLYKRFETPYCLIIQDDGFPIRDNLGDFLGKWDYIGSPTVRDVPAQKLVDWFHYSCINGGFSLRSKRLCSAVARSWKFWGRFMGEGSSRAVEDVYYTQTFCLNPINLFRFRWPTCREARRFAVLDFDGALDVDALETNPFGVHGASTARQTLRED